MNMKMKLLDYTLMGLLAGMTAQAQAQTSPTQDIHCTDSGCKTQEGLLFSLSTRGAAEPVSNAGHSRDAEALAPDRRVTVGMTSAPTETQGKARATGKFSVALPSGGAIWATEDPVLGQAELSISAPSIVAFDGKAITSPVQFYVRSNYSAFVERYEIYVYRGSDVDLIEPIATLPVKVDNVGSLEWSGELPGKYLFRAGDQLAYVVRAYGADGQFDETYASTLQLVSPEEAALGAQSLRERTEKLMGTALSETQAETQSLLDEVFAGNGLRLQNIPLYGSRVRIQGRNIPRETQLTINGESYPVDLERKFTADYLVPVGQHRFDIGVGGQGQAGKDAAAHHTLDVDVTGRYFFGVGLADVTVSQNKISGSTATFASDSRYQDDIISDGRLAFYGKAKFRGKYLVTAQADTTEKDLEHLFDGFTDAYALDVFRNLDPDLYYPVYGDDSTTYRDVDTQGRFYLRADWDKNEALWGNFGTGLGGTEYAQYVRSLYGAAVNWRSRNSNAWGDPGTELRVFGSQTQSAPGHNEFLGTGGSLYYLRNTNVLAGSDVVQLQVRDLTTGRLAATVTLTRGVDYEIDNTQGRLILTRPLAQITRNNVPTLTRDAPLDGLEQRLVIDYEWIPTGFDTDELAVGFRGKHWLGNHVGIGATYVQQEQSGQDYTLKGADLTLQAGKGTFLKAEYAESESLGVPVYFSNNGGFTFEQIGNGGLAKGSAEAVEMRANLKELGWTAQDWTLAAWHRSVDAGFASSSNSRELDTLEYGAEVQGQLADNLRLYARYNRAEAGTDALTQAQLTAEWRVSDASTWAAEIRRVNEDYAGQDMIGVLGALKYTHRFGSALELYGLAQGTLDDDGGRYEDNNAVTLGGKYLYGDRSTIGADITHGDRGDAVTANAQYQVNANQSVYGSYTYSVDRTDGYQSPLQRDVQNGWTLGQRWRLSNQVNLFNESQFLKSDRTTSASGLAHTVGMDFYPAQGWNLGAVLGFGDLTTSDGGEVERRTVSVSGGRTSEDTDWQSKLEWRRDTGAEQREQWVSTNRLTHKINESWRIAARLNYSDTDDELDPTAGARFIESNLGFAWRPVDSARWSLFGRHTYLYDVSTLSQAGGAEYDQKTQVLSLEGVYKPDARWEMALKLARREGEVRFGRGQGGWADSATTLAAGQVRYDLAQQWHALAEYRWLDVKDGGTRTGWLVGVDRDLGKNFRVGVGYNFTDFSDDLTDFDYDHRGWFINLVGKY